MATRTIHKGSSGQSHIRTVRHRSLLFAVAILLAAQMIALQAQKPTRRVLVFNDFGSISSPGMAILDQSIAMGLEGSPYQIELYNETIESTLFPDEASQRRIRDWYAEKYSERKPDVIVTVGPGSLRYMAGSHQNQFPNTPIIFCGTTEE